VCAFLRLIRAAAPLQITGILYDTAVGPKAAQVEIVPSAPPRNIDSSGTCNLVRGVFTPVLAQHTKSFNLVDTLSVGVDRIQRNFEPLQRQVEYWRQAQITDERAKLILYAAFVDGNLDAPRSLLQEVHRLYF
jgi:hypothetical protein